MIRATSLALLLSVAAAGQTHNSSSTFQDLSAQAKQAYEANHLHQAAQLFAQTVKLKPDWTEGWWALGMIDYQLDEYRGCQDALNRMVQLDDSAAPGFALLGLCEFQLKQYDAAFEHLKKAHMLVPPTVPGGQLLTIANFRLAELLTRQGAFEVAEQIYLDVALRVQNNPSMVFAAGLACLRMPMLPSDVPENDRDVVTMAGQAYWDIAAAPPAKTDALFRSLVAKYPNFPNVHYFYGTYLAAHHPDQCAPQFLDELRVNPASVPARVELCLRYIVLRKFDEAIKMGRIAVALSPESVGPQLALGEAYQAQGNNKLALVLFQQAARIDPESPQIRMYLMQTYRNLGRFEDVKRQLAAYQRLKATQPNWP